MEALNLIKREKRYAIHSMVKTIQGEGYHAGKLAIFIRTNSCNIWSGREEDRERDSKKGSCAKFCDTEFFGTDEKKGGGRFTAQELVKRCREMWGHKRSMFVVLTGGEPALQVDQNFVDTFKREGMCSLAMETNGSVPFKFEWIDWVTLSPKPPMPVFENNVFDEIKVLYPEYNPLDFLHLEVGIKSIQPVDPPRTDGFYMDEFRANMRKCVEFVHANPSWRISIQQHKVLGIP